MSRILATAASEFRIAFRNRWVSIATGMMVLFALVLAAAGAAPTGDVGVDRLSVTVASLTSLAVYLVPLLALLMSFDAVAGEVERGTLPLLLTYPVHQAADILFCKANLVPVGQDQLPHIELTRQIASRFDRRYGRDSADNPVFRRPDALLSKAPAILGTDGTKMSKSRGNTIELGMSADETAKILKKAKTDSNRVITYDPIARPEVSNLLLLASMASDEEPEAIAQRIGDGGGGVLKAMVTEAINDHLAPLRARRAELEADAGYLLSVLEAGITQANETANATLLQAREAMGMVY